MSTPSIKRHFSLHCRCPRSHFDFEIPANDHTDFQPPPRTEYICYTCNKVFAKKSYLREHIKYKLEGKRRIRMCDICGKNVRNYTQHMRMHSGKRAPPPPSRTCEICGKSCSAVNYETHIKIVHSDKRPFLCGTCGKSFKRKNALTVHEKTHAGIKSHKCPVCDKAFFDRTTMRKHWVRHAKTRKKRSRN